MMRGIFAAFALLFVVARGWATPAAVVTTAQGPLQVRHANTTSPLASGKSLEWGDRVICGAGSKATILFSDGSHIKLNALTTIELQQGGAALFKLIRGEAWARPREGRAVQTRSAIAGVIGTEILIAVDENEITTLTVLEGAADFSNAQGHVRLGENQRSVARLGAAPTAPVTLANPGLIMEWTLDLERALVPRERFYVSLDRIAVRGQMEKLRAAASISPPAPSAFMNYGDALFDDHQYEAALAQYSAAERLLPRDSNLKVRLGYAALELDRLAEAASYFKTARAGATTQGAAVGADEILNPEVGLAWLALTQDRPQEAQGWAQKALAAQPRPTATGASGALVEAEIALGVALMRQPGLEGAALDALHAASRIASPYKYQALAWRALVLQSQGDGAAALDTARQAVSLAPLSALAHGNAALVYFFNGQSGPAVREARRAVSINPTSVAARVALGQSLLADGDTEGAASAAAQLVALDSKMPQARFLLGVAQASRRDYLHAEKQLAATLRLAPDFLPAAAALARVYNATGQGARAIAVVAALEPRSRQADAIHGALGEIYFDQGNYIQSEKRYRDALAKKPNSALYLAGLARTLMDSNQLSEAIGAARAAVQIAPRVGQYHALLGQVYDFSHLGAQAEREYRQALTHDPRNALAMTQLALKQGGTDLRPVASSFTQGFLNDPALPRQLFRGGIGVETSPSAGSDGLRGSDVFHRLTASQGRLNEFGFISSQRSDGQRANADGRVFDAAQFVTLSPRAGTELFGAMRLQGSERGLSGSLAAPQADDRNAFHYGEVQLAGKKQHGRETYWAGLRGNDARSLTNDPGADSFTGLFPAFPVTGQKFDTMGLAPEFRYDRSTGSAARRGLFTFGLAHTRATFDGRRTLTTPLPGVVGSERFAQDNSTQMAYAQWSGPVNEKLTITAQLRGEREDRQRAQSAEAGGVSILTAGDTRRRKKLLPGVVAQYQLGKTSSLRFNYNERFTDVVTPTFAPTDMTLTTTAAALPFGTPESMKLMQLDFDQYLGAHDFLKLFAFRTAAANTQIGGPDTLGFGGLPAPSAPSLGLAAWRAQGIGARYEKQLGRSWFAGGGLTLRQTKADGVTDAPYEPRRLATLELSYLSRRGEKATLRMRYNGAFFADTPGVALRPNFAAQTYVDLLLAREPSLRGELFLNVLNLFDRPALLFNDFPAPGRQIQAGYTRRF